MHSVQTLLAHLIPTIDWLPFGVHLSPTLIIQVELILGRVQRAPIFIAVMATLAICCSPVAYRACTAASRFW